MAACASEGAGGTPPASGTGRGRRRTGTACQSWKKPLLPRAGRWLGPWTVSCLLRRTGVRSPSPRSGTSASPRAPHSHGASARRARPVPGTGRPASVSPRSRRSQLPVWRPSRRCRAGASPSAPPSGGGSARRAGPAPGTGPPASAPRTPARPPLRGAGSGGGSVAGGSPAPSCPSTSASGRPAAPTTPPGASVRMPSRTVRAPANAGRGSAPRFSRLPACFSCFNVLTPQSVFFSPGSGRQRREGPRAPGVSRFASRDNDVDDRGHHLSDLVQQEHNHH